MKRFVLFQGDDYYPLGGWEDRAGNFDTLEEAQQAYTTGGHGWAHVVDLSTDAIASEHRGPQSGWKPYESWDR